MNRNIKGDLIFDFLESPKGQEEGYYYFEEHYRSYFSDIDPNYFYYKITREPTSDDYGIILLKYSDIQMGEVFSPQKTSQFTYVDRKIDGQQTYDASLRIASKVSGNTIVLHGNSKLGKTALWESVLGHEAIRVHCGYSVNIESLYKTLFDEINTPHIETSESSTSGSTVSEVGGNFTADAGIIKSTVGAKDSKTKSTQEKKTYRYPEKEINAQAVCKLIAAVDGIVVFENYHRLNGDVFRALCIDLRTFADYGITTVFVGIPANPAEFVTINPELLGRIQYMKFEPWPTSELRKIALNGAEALKVVFPDDIIDFISSEAAGSPLLMQLYCYCACLSSGIFSVSESDYSEKVDFDVTRFSMIVKEYGKQFLMPYIYLVDTMKNHLDNDGKLFIDALLSFVKTEGPSIEYDIGELSNGYDAFEVIETICRKMQEHDFFSIDRMRNVLLINDPLLIAYIRWVH